MKGKIENEVEEYEKMLEEATVGCYNEEEEFTGVLYTLQDKLKFPFDAIALGSHVQILDVDEDKSG